MKTQNILKSITFLFAVLFLASCSNKVQLPYYSRVENITKLAPGQNSSQVNTLLNVEPHDIYVDISNQNRVLVYKYRRRYQKVVMKFQRDANSLKDGSEVYREEGNLYCIFSENDDKLIYYVTDYGRDNGTDILLNEGKIKLYLSDPSKFIKVDECGPKTENIGAGVVKKPKSGMAFVKSCCMLKGCFGLFKRR